VEACGGEGDADVFAEGVVGVFVDGGGDAAEVVVRVEGE
jgi:hypothetical protein